MPQQFSEGGAGEFSQDVVLLPHGGQIVDLEIARGEVIVPQQREPLAQCIGREEHAKDPPGLEPIGRRRRRGRVSKRRGNHLEVFHGAVDPRLPLQDTRDAGLGPVAQIALDLVPRGGKPRAAMQVRDPGEIPRSLLRRSVGRPRIVIRFNQAFHVVPSVQRPDRSLISPRSIVLPEAIAILSATVERRNSDPDATTL
jgi:hypothetical protein